MIILPNSNGQLGSFVKKVDILIAEKGTRIEPVSVPSHPTSGTLFHKVKFPILKVLYMVYFVATNMQGISSAELSRKRGLDKRPADLLNKR